MNRVLLFSGGIDSYALWHLMGYPTPVYVKLGHKYEQHELATIARLGLSNRVVVLDGPAIGHTEADDGHIPQRNLLLVATVAAEIQPDMIAIGALAGETSRDKSWRFLRDTQRLLSWLERPIKVRAPAKRYTKTQLVKHFLQKHPDELDTLLKTISCYAAGDLPCGRCQSCFRRWVAMSNNGIEEQYQQAPWAEISVQFGYLWRTPVSEWPAVIHNNLDAYRALRRVRKNVQNQQAVPL